VPPWPRLVESLRTAPVVRVGDYDYFVHPLTDGVPPVEADVLAEAVAALRSLLPIRFDLLLAPEAMALPLAAGLGLATGRPFVVARKRPYGLPGEVAVEYATGYSTGRFHINHLPRDASVVLVDDVASRGGTVRALADAIRRAGARLEKVIILFNKDLDLAALGRDVGAPVEAVLNVRVENGHVEVLPVHATARL
jgi:adenine phosphoribosyltransferase